MGNLGSRAGACLKAADTHKTTHSNKLIPCNRRFDKHALSAVWFLRHLSSRASAGSLASRSHLRVCEGVSNLPRCRQLELEGKVQGPRCETQAQQVTDHF